MNIIFWLGFKKDPVGINPRERYLDEGLLNTYSQELINPKVEIKAETDLIVGHFFNIPENLLFKNFKNQERTYETLKESVKALIKEDDTYLERFEKEDLLDWDNILIYTEENKNRNLFDFSYAPFRDFIISTFDMGIIDGIARYPKPKYHNALRILEDCDRFQKKREFEEKMGDLYKHKIFFLGFKGSPNEKINKDTDLIVGHVCINDYETKFPHLVKETILSYPEKNNKNLDKDIEKFNKMGVLDWDNILIIDNKHYYNGGIALNLMSRGAPKIFNLEPIKHPEKDTIDYSKIFEGVYRFNNTPYETAKDIMDEINGDKFRKEIEEIHKAIFGDENE